jgi:hypothetical protein
VESRVGYDSIGKLNFWIPKLESPMSDESPNAFDIDQWTDVDHAVFHAILEPRPFDSTPRGDWPPNDKFTKHRSAKFLAGLCRLLLEKKILTEDEINELSRNCRQ